MMEREPNGQLSPHILCKPLAPNLEPIATELALMLVDYMPSSESVSYALYYGQGLAHRRLNQWLDRSADYLELFPNNEHTTRLHEMRDDITAQL